MPTDHDMLEIAVETAIDDATAACEEIAQLDIHDGLTQEAREMDLASHMERLEKIRGRINHLLELIRRRCASLSEQKGALTGERITVETQRLIDMLTALKTQLDSLDAVAEALEWRYAQAGKAASPRLAAIRARLKPVAAFVARVLRNLWQLLLKLMTPKEWKLSGKIGAAMFGLADVGIEVTFGP
jgi:hypothetical protein